ncbi:SHOCT domain-containing protein [Haloarcula sebkhae]|uniref:SHOCT domain-containing protein n=2 Tax=Haloarcula sebkhae TaxID=932660 RepID=A0ACC6VLB3_9EURY|nr:SHOCT domain-containing protein [Haloarcula sebkhae]
MRNRIAQLIPESLRPQATLAVSSFVLGVIFLGSWLTAAGEHLLDPSHVSAGVLVLFFVGAGCILSSICLVYAMIEQSIATDRGAEDEDTDSAIEILRKQYATGEITDEEFKRRMNTLAQSEDTDQREQAESPAFEDSVNSPASADSPSTAELNMDHNR